MNTKRTSYVTNTVSLKSENESFPVITPQNITGGGVISIQLKNVRSFIVINLLTSLRDRYNLAKTLNSNWM